MTVDSAIARDPLPDCGNPSSDPDAESAVTGAVTVIVCSSCRHPDTPATTTSGEADAAPRSGALLAADAVRAAEASSVIVKHIACLGNCKRGLSAAMLKPGAWSYVFGGLDVDSGDDLIAGAELFAGSVDGFMPFRARPESLKRGLIARIPTFDTLKDLP